MAEAPVVTAIRSSEETSATPYLSARFKFKRQLYKVHIVALQMISYGVRQSRMYYRSFGRGQRTVLPVLRPKRLHRNHIKDLGRPYQSSHQILFASHAAVRIGKGLSEHQEQVLAVVYVKYLFVGRMSAGYLILNDLTLKIKCI